MAGFSASNLLPPHRAAFPAGEPHRLLAAAIHADDETALRSAVGWLDANSLDEARFREQRLLIAVLARFGARLEGHRDYQRLTGMQRMLWTRTMLLLREARPAFAKMAAADVRIMLIKGAARLADGGEGKRGRSAYDLDIVVRPGGMAAAFDCLVGEGWTPSTGASVAKMRNDLPALRGLNMFKGRYGDIDLHAYAFHPGQGDGADDDRLWADASQTVFNGTPAGIPAPEDRIALSVAHGGLDAHTHSDWLVDMAAMLQDHPTHWDRLEDIIARRGIAVPAAIALSYLRERMDMAIDEPMLARLSRSARRSPAAYLSGFLQTRPRERETRFGAALRGWAKHVRKRAAKRHLPPPAMHNRVQTSVSRLPGHAIAATSLRKRYEIDVSALEKGMAVASGEIRVPLPPVSRRLEFEINSDAGHVAHFRHRVLVPWPGRLTLKFRCAFDLPHGAKTLWLEARPGRSARTLTTPRHQIRYEAIAFALERFEVRPR